MSRPGIALLGAGGQLGKTLQADWAANAPSEWQLHAFTRAELDIRSPEQLAQRLDPLAIQVVVNAAAYTRVDRAESERDRAMAINRDGVAHLAQWVAARGCRLIHVSTDFVFDGRAGQPRQPGDATAPLNHYGQSKRAGELAVLAACADRAVILRTGWLYSRYQPNFVTTMLRLMSEREQLGVVSDQVGTPTSTHSLGRLIARIVQDEEASGVFHWSDAGVASWYDFAVAIQEEALAAGLLHRAIPVSPISTADYPTPASRPAYSVLDKTASYRRFEMAATHWREELRQVIAELKADRQG